MAAEKLPNQATGANIRSSINNHADNIDSIVNTTVSLQSQIDDLSPQDLSDYLKKVDAEITYQKIDDSVRLGETISTAYRGDRGKIAYDHSQIISGNPHGTKISDISELQTELDSKVEHDGAKVLSDVNFSTAKDTKLSGIATGATVNSSDATLLNRANHTGSQAISTVTGLQESLDTKVTIASSQVILTDLTFTSDSVSGTIAAPITGNITGNITGASLGVTVLVIHNSGTEPTFDSKFKKLSGSGDYVISEVNYIYCQYIDATTILYSINQAV